MYTNAMKILTSTSIFVEESLHPSSLILTSILTVTLPRSPEEKTWKIVIENCLHKRSPDKPTLFGTT